MKKFKINSILFTLFLSFGMLCQAQPVTKTSYFVENATLRHLLNPALAPSRGYFSIPALSELYLSSESNLKFTNFIFPANSASNGELRTFMHPTVNADDFLDALKEDQFLRLDLRNSLFSFGYWAGASSFISFELASRTNISTNLPKDFFAFFKKGMSDAAGNTYHLDHLSFGVSEIAEASLGYSLDVSKRLRFGLKGKFLAGGAKLKAELEEMQISMGPDSWSVSSKGRIDAYGKGLSFVKDTSQNITNVELEGNSLGLGGMGLALDLGFEYSILPGLKLSMALIDIGGIKWDQANIKSATSSGSVTFSGLNDFNPDSVGRERMDAQLEEMKDNMLEMTKFKEVPTTEDFLEKFKPTFHMGLEYSMKKISIGGLLTSRVIGDKRYNDYTASLNLKPLKMFNLTGSYSFLYGERENFGFALGFAPGLFNLYLSCDYVPTKFNPQYIPLNTATTNFQVGLSIPLNKRKKKVIDPIEEDEHEDFFDGENTEEEEEFIIVGD